MTYATDIPVEPVRQGWDEIIVHRRLQRVGHEVPSSIAVYSHSGRQYRSGAELRRDFVSSASTVQDVRCSRFLEFGPIDGLVVVAGMKHFETMKETEVLHIEVERLTHSL